MTTNTYAYFPGCSLEGTAREYDESFRRVCDELGAQLVELDDWSCCGASAAHSTNAFLATALPARNLRLAQEVQRDLVAPCAMCWSRLRAARQRAESAAADLGLLPGRVPEVVSALELIVERVGLESLEAAVRVPLEGLRVVPYYGCLYVRPAEIAQHPDPENPQELDRILTALGADVRAWSSKTECCGGSLSIARPTVVAALVDGLLQAASEAGADIVVTACPMCTANLEMRRSNNAPALPVAYFTELMGVALGLDEAPGWFRRHLVSVGPLVGRRPNATNRDESQAGVGVTT